MKSKLFAHTDGKQKGDKIKTDSHETMRFLMDQTINKTLIEFKTM